MADYYYRSDVAGPGSGTLADPWKDPASGTPGPNNRYFYYSTSLWTPASPADTAGFFPYAKVMFDNVQFLAYGPSGSNPTFSGFRTVTSWNYDATTNCYWTTVTYGGIVTRGGQVLKQVHWPPGTMVAGGISQLVNSMPLDSYTIDYEDSPNRVYIRISGNIGDATLQVSDVRNILNTNPTGSGTNTGLVIDSLAFTGASRSAILLTRNVGQLRNLQIKACGGERDPLLSVWQGTGIEVIDGSDGSIIDNCSIGYVYNAPVAITTSTTSATLTNVTVQNSTLYESGRSGIEVRAQANSVQLSGHTLQLNTVYNIGSTCSSWNSSLGYVGTGIRLAADVTSGKVYSCAARRNTLRNCQIGASVQSRTGGTNDFTGSLVLNPGQRNQSGFLVIHGLSHTIMDVFGTTVENVTNAFDTDTGLGSTSAYNSTNCTVVSCVNAWNTNSQSTVISQNNIIQGCSGNVLNGTAGSLLSISNYVSGNASLGTYVLAGSDKSQVPVVSFDSTTRYVPVSGSSVYTGGTNTTSTAPDFSGNSFGSPSWSQGAYATFVTNTFPLTTAGVLTRNSWFSLLKSPSVTQFTWAPRSAPTVDQGSGFFIFFE